MKEYILAYLMKLMSKIGGFKYQDIYIGKNDEVMAITLSTDELYIDKIKNISIYR